MAKINGFEFLKPIGENSLNMDTKRIAHTLNYGVYINREAELYIHDIQNKQLIPFKTNKDVTKLSTIHSLFDAYKLIFE